MSGFWWIVIFLKSNFCPGLTEAPAALTCSLSSEACLLPSFKPEDCTSVVDAQFFGAVVLDFCWAGFSTRPVLVGIGWMGRVHKRVFISIFCVEFTNWKSLLTNQPPSDAMGEVLTCIRSFTPCACTFRRRMMRRPSLKAWVQ